jgi:imidazolonepropionase-like amidohydrolase
MPILRRPTRGWQAGEPNRHTWRLDFLGDTMTTTKRAGLALLATAGFALPAAAQDLVISNARVLDGTGAVIERGTVVVRAGRIASLGANAGNAPANAVRIDAGGRTVMPGFIDAHRHIIQGDPARWLAEQSTANMREFLEAGFTTVFSAIDAPEQILELRRRTESGETVGPRIISAAFVPLSRAVLGGAGDPARTDPARSPDRPLPTAPSIPPEESLAAVRAAAARGHDAIKTLIIITRDGPEAATLKLIADEARRLNLLNITHAVSVIDTLAAVEAGTDVLVHTPHIGQLDEATAKKIADADIPRSSTLGVFVPYFNDANMPLFRDRQQFPFETLSSAGQGPVNARLLFQAGITYAYGTDTSWSPRDSLAHELRPLSLVFSNEDLIPMITRNAAIASGRGEDLGTLEAGKIADIVILGSDPLRDEDALLDVDVVIKGGKVVVGGN